MTELTLEEAIVDIGEAEPAIIYKNYLSSIDEVVEAVKAADALGLGFRVESYTVTSPDGEDSQHGEFEFTLLGDMPMRQEGDD